MIEINYISCALFCLHQSSALYHSHPDHLLWLWKESLRAEFFPSYFTVLNHKVANFQYQFFISLKAVVNFWSSLPAFPQNNSSGFILLFMGGKEMVFHHFILFFPLVILFFCELVRVVQEPSRNNTTLHLKSLLKHWRTYPSCDQMGLDYHVTWLFMDRFQSQPNQFITELD